LLIAGNGRPSLKNILVFTAGVVVMRAAGCVMNDIADRNYDPYVARTRNRPLACGDLTIRQALTAFALLMALALGLVLMTNLLTIMLACAGALLAASYPFFKRFTHLPQVVLGIAFGWGIPMAFAAETGAIASVAWILLGVNIIWAIIYDTLYAMVDRDDDLAIGVKSTAILFGRHDLLVVRILMAAMILLLLFLGRHYDLGWPWFAGVAVAGALFAWQLWIIRRREPERCFRAFMNNNWVGLAIFLGLAGHFA
jgi:4-hydroxybenzoate polyprenyltransferase